MLPLLLSALLNGPVRADVLVADDYALPILVQYFDLEPPRQRKIAAMLTEATRLIAAHPPRPDHLFAWTGDRTVLEHKAYRLIFADSHASAARPEILPLLGVEGRGGSYVQENEFGHTMGTTVIFVDRYFDQPDDRPRYVYPHLVLDLARHFYGIVQIYLDSPIIPGRDEAMEVDEDLGFAVALKFLDQFLAGEHFHRVDDLTRDAMLAAHAGLSSRRDELTRCGVLLSPTAAPVSGPIRH